MSVDPFLRSDSQRTSSHLELILSGPESEKNCAVLVAGDHLAVRQIRGSFLNHPAESTLQDLKITSVPNGAPSAVDGAAGPR